MPDKFVVPKFTNEAEEAEWWFEHQDELAEAFQGAADQGGLHRGSVAGMARERGAVEGGSHVTIRLNAEEGSGARTLAAKRGLPYGEFLKVLLREALESEEKKLAS